MAKVSDLPFLFMCFQLCLPIFALYFTYTIMLLHQFIILSRSTLNTSKKICPNPETLEQKPRFRSTMRSHSGIRKLLCLFFLEMIKYFFTYTTIFAREISTHAGLSIDFVVAWVKSDPYMLLLLRAGSKPTSFNAQSVTTFLLSIARIYMRDRRGHSPPSSSPLYISRSSESPSGEREGTNEKRESFHEQRKKEWTLTHLFPTLLHTRIDRLFFYDIFADFSLVFFLVLLSVTKCLDYSCLHQLIQSQRWRNRIIHRKCK